MYYQQWLNLDDYCICMEQVSRMKSRCVSNDELNLPLWNLLLRCEDED